MTKSRHAALGENGSGSEERVPTISIGLPVYNAERFLEKAIDSILSQSFSDLELIISNNASTDRTEEICRAYVAKDSRVRYSRVDKNLGAAWNFSHVVKEARGEYFKWVAADDVCAPTMLLRCLDVLKREPETVVAYPKTTLIDEKGETIKDYEDNLNLQRPSVTNRFIQLSRSIGECNAVFGLIRSNVLKNSRLIGNYQSSDRCLLAELTLHGKFWEIPERLFFRRVHPGSSSCHKDVESQLEFFDPSRKGSIVLPFWRLLYEDFLTVKRTSIRIRDKALLFGYLFCKLIRGRRQYANDVQLAVKQWFARRGKRSRSLPTTPA